MKNATMWLHPELVEGWQNHRMERKMQPCGCILSLSKGGKITGQNKKCNHVVAF